MKNNPFRIKKAQIILRRFQKEGIWPNPKQMQLLVQYLDSTYSKVLYSLYTDSTNPNHPATHLTAVNKM
jgi:hypothetical protein